MNQQEIEALALAESGLKKDFDREDETYYQREKVRIYDLVIKTCQLMKDKAQVKKEQAEKLAMDKLKGKWSHLYLSGYPQKPYPTHFENDLNCVMLGLLHEQEA